MLHVDNHILSSGTYVCVVMFTRYFVVCLTVQSCTRRGLLKHVHTGVRPWIYLVFLIHLYNLIYQHLPCNSICTPFLDYICIYVVIVFQQSSLCAWEFWTLQFRHGWLFSPPGSILIIWISHLKYSWCEI